MKASTDKGRLWIADEQGISNFPPQINTGDDRRKNIRYRERYPDAQFPNKRW